MQMKHHSKYLPKIFQKKSFDNLFKTCTELAKQYQFGGSNYNDFAIVLEEMQKYPDPLYAIFRYHGAIGLYNSYEFWISRSKGIYCMQSFNLKQKNDIDTFIQILKDQSYENHLVGPNTNGFVEGYRRKYMYKYGFGATFDKLYPNLD